MICVGNINAGGTGKTPVVIALVERLEQMGVSAHVISRGYGGSETGPIAVDPTVHDASMVGDEPLLMSAFSKVWVARDRAPAAEMAEARGAEAIVLDDGHQNPDLPKDLSLVVVDAGVGFGNGRVIPAGPLREPVLAGLRRADALIVIGDDAARERFFASEDVPANTRLLKARLEIVKTGLPLRGLPVLAFAGIGRPEKFFETLRQEGAEVIRSVPLGDHQPLSAGLMNRLLADARKFNAQVVTTEKDAVRLPADFRQKVMTVPVRLVFDEVETVDQMLRAILPA